MHSSDENREGGQWASISITSLGRVPAKVRTFARLCASLTEEAERSGGTSSDSPSRPTTKARAIIIRTPRARSSSTSPWISSFLLRRTPGSGVRSRRGVLFVEGRHRRARRGRRGGFRGRRRRQQRKVSAAARPPGLARYRNLRARDGPPSADRCAHHRACLGRCSTGRRASTSCRPRRAQARRLRRALRLRLLPRRTSAACRPLKSAPCDASKASSAACYRSSSCAPISRCRVRADRLRARRGRHRPRRSRRCRAPHRPCRNSAVFNLRGCRDHRHRAGRPRIPDPPRPSPEATRAGCQGRRADPPRGSAAPTGSRSPGRIHAGRRDDRARRLSDLRAPRAHPRRADRVDAGGRGRGGREPARRRLLVRVRRGSRARPRPHPRRPPAPVHRGDASASASATPEAAIALP